MSQHAYAQGVSIWLDLSPGGQKGSAYTLMNPPATVSYDGGLHPMRGPFAKSRLAPFVSSPYPGPSF